ncbi:MAG: alpha-galactosidase [Clostridia bacterium]|nr:alpha-galactosidase [Clostridia bacterium]
MKNYCDIFYQPGENPAFCYRTSKTVYEEMLYQGGLISCGWNSAGYPLNLLEKCSTRIDKRRFLEPYAFNIEIDGMSLDYCLEFVNFEKQEDGDKIKSVLTLKSRIRPVLIKIHTLLDSTAMFTRYIEIENLSDSYLNLSRLSVMAGPMEVMELEKFTESKNLNEFYSIGYFENDNWGREGEFVWKSLNTEITSIDTRFNRDRFRHPMLFIRNNLTGKIWFMQTAFSGGCRFTVDYNAQKDRNTTRLAFKAEILSHKPMFVIKPKETFISPEVHIGNIFGDVDEAVNEMHSHIRKSVLNLKETDPSSALIGCGMGAEHDMTVETTKEYIRQFAEMGGEVFIIDAGWACPPGEEGNWSAFNGRNIPDKDRYPDGIEEIRDYCHENGLKFAMWVDIESIGEQCNLHNKRPEWFSVNPFGEKSGKYLDMSRDDVAEWAENELARIITEYKLELLRVDHNVDFTEYFGMRENEAGIPECVSIRHINAVYRMYERLKKRFPDVIFENCAGGGGRTDLGMMKNFNHSWVSDWQCAPYSVIVTNGMTMALPPERVDRLFAGMGCHAYGSFDLQMRNCMLGHMSLNVISPPGASINREQMEFVQHSVKIYKNFLRPFLAESKIYHHTPDLKKDDFAVIEISAPDSSRGAIGIFALAGAKGNKNIRPKGIDMSKNYIVYYDNDRCSFTISGRELKQKGIEVDISSSMASELVLYEAIE